MRLRARRERRLVLVQAASIALACVANDTAHVEQVLNNAVQWIEHNRPDLQVVDWQIEIL